jgi:predicted acylesterase/phospholipase RssA
MAGTNQSPSRIGLALAGGGPEGAIYEIGALRALDEALEGIDFTDVPIYVGVSAGAFIGACLANGLTPTQLARRMYSAKAGVKKIRVSSLLPKGRGALVTPGRSVRPPRDTSSVAVRSSGRSPGSRAPFRSRSSTTNRSADT